MNFAIFVISVGALCALAACDGADPLAGLGEPALMETHERAPPGAPEGSCWGKDVTPAVIETVTERILLQPAEVQNDGTVLAEPIYKLETRRAIVKERRELWFQTPCEDQLTPEFLSSLQRALAARGHYRGATTGKMDTRTLRAIRRYQEPQGLNSAILSLSAARKLGLIAIDRPEES